MDRPAYHPRRSPLLVAVSTAGAIAVGLAPAAAAGTWLLVTDPAVAADVAVKGNLWPVAEALVKIVGRAIADVLVYL